MNSADHRINGDKQINCKWYDKYMVYHHTAKMGQYFPIQKHIQNNQQICQSCTSQVITYMYAKILWHNKIRDNQKYHQGK